MCLVDCVAAGFSSYHHHHHHHRDHRRRIAKRQVSAIESNFAAVYSPKKTKKNKQNKNKKCNNKRKLECEEKRSKESKIIFSFSSSFALYL
jgi:hypothetical protein